MHVSSLGLICLCLPSTWPGASRGLRTICWVRECSSLFHVTHQIQPAWGLQQHEEPKWKAAPNSCQQRRPKVASLVGKGEWLGLRVPLSCVRMEILSLALRVLQSLPCLSGIIPTAPNELLLSQPHSSSLALYLHLTFSSLCTFALTWCCPPPRIPSPPPCYLNWHQRPGPSASPGQQRLFPLTHPSFTYHQIVLLINYSALPVTSFGVFC